MTNEELKEWIYGFFSRKDRRHLEIDVDRGSVSLYASPVYLLTVADRFLRNKRWLSSMSNHETQLYLLTTDDIADDVKCGICNPRSFRFHVNKDAIQKDIQAGLC